MQSALLLLITGGRIDGFVPFSRALAWNEMAMFRIWTLITDCIFYDHGDVFSIKVINLDQSAGAVEYANCRGVRPPLPNEYPGYNIKQSDVEGPGMLVLWGM